MTSVPMAAPLARPQLTVPNPRELLPIEHHLPLHRHEVQQWLATTALDITLDLPAQLREVRALLVRDGYTIASVRGLAALPRRQRNAVVVAFSSLLGTPSPVNATADLVVWDVRPRRDLSDEQRAANISVSWGEACLHTDSTFAPVPERWFGLWCLRPATVGGASILVDVHRVVTAMRADPLAWLAVSTLRAVDLPLWNGRDLAWVRVLGGPGEPAVRYRADMIGQGIVRAGLTRDDSRVQALRTLEAVLADARHRTQVRLVADEVLFVDNHRVLHGRENFTDLERHLLRVRMTEPPLVAA